MASSSNVVEPATYELETVTALTDIFNWAKVPGDIDYVASPAGSGVRAAPV